MCPSGNQDLREVSLLGIAHYMPHMLGLLKQCKISSLTLTIVYSSSLSFHFTLSLLAITFTQLSSISLSYSSPSLFSTERRFCLVQKGPLLID